MSKRRKSNDKSSAKDASVTDLVYSRITGLQETNRSKQSETPSEASSKQTGPMLMMFQKVEAGKQVAESLF
jgi:hypothetical protein